MALLVRIAFLGLGVSAVVGLHVRGPHESSSTRVMYGFETCNKTWANAAMSTASATWLMHIPRKHLVISGGAYDDHVQGLDNEANPCEDSKAALACKEAVMLYRAAVRMRQSGAEWLVVGQEDKYINTGALQKWLDKYDPSQPKVVSAFGCGRSWTFAAKASGKDPNVFPQGWVQPSYQCKAVYENAGICGGPTYAISQRALELLHKPGQTMAEFIDDMLGASEHNVPGASDIASSCFFYKHGIPLHSDSFYSSCPIGGNFGAGGNIEEAVNKLPNTITYHLSVSDKRLLPEIMKQIHRRVLEPESTDPRSLFVTEGAETDGEPFYLQYPNLVWPKNVPFS